MRTAITTLLFPLLWPLCGAAAEPAALPPPAAPQEPRVQQTVIEDDGARVEELRVRGETQRLSVTSKGPFFKSHYDIVVPRQGRDAALAGKPVWSVLSF